MGRDAKRENERLHRESNLIVRSECAVDFPAIRLINEAAFGSSEEADLVERLRAEGVTLLSLVAEMQNQLVGHILFSRMWIDTGENSTPAVALAPMAVVREYQRRGIGGQLIRAGLDALRGLGERVVIVVGHPDYYPRFGFSSELTRSLASPFPPEPFMALELSPGACDGIRGRVRYPESFGL